MGRGPTLSAPEQALVRDALRALVSRYASQLAAAKSTGLPQRAINKILAGKQDPGYDFARRLAAVIGITTDEMLGAAAQSERPALATLPGWADAAATAVRDHPHLAEQIHAVGRVGVPDQIALTPAWIANLAHHYWQGVVRPAAPPRTGKAPRTRQ